MAEIEWTGPKEWRPERWKPSPFLTDEENLRVGKMFAQFRLKGAPTPSADEVRWLIDVLARVSSGAPNEFEFPQYAALYNPEISRAYAVVYRESLQVEQRITCFGTVTDTQLLDQMITEQVCDATLLVRPYVRIVRGQADSVEALRRFTLTMEIDGVKVMKVALEESLIGPAGELYRKIPWSVKWRSTYPLFPAVVLNENAEADPSKFLGIFCPNGTRIKVEMLGSGVIHGDMEIAVGLVAARYTTKR